MGIIIAEVELKGLVNTGGAKGDKVLHFLYQGQGFLVPFLRKKVARRKCLKLILKSNRCFARQFFSFSLLYFTYLSDILFVYPRATRKRYRLSNSGTLFYLTFVSRYLSSSISKYSLILKVS